MNLPEPRSSFVLVGSRRLRVVEWGEASRPALLLLHGIRDHARSWDWVAAALADRFRIVAPDLRGHGDSDWVDPAAYTLAAFVLDVADVVAALRLDRFVLVGHSFGGVVGLRYAAAFPDRVSALCGIECVELPSVREQRLNPRPFPHRLRKWIEAERAGRGRRPRAYDSLLDATQRMRDNQPTLDAETADHLATHGVTLGADGGWRWKFDNAPRLRAPDDADGRDLDEVLTAVECPVLLCYGDASWIPLPPPERLALLRDHRLAMFPGASHWLHHQARDAFLAALTEFLDQSNESTSHA